MLGIGASTGGTQAAGWLRPVGARRALALVLLLAHQVDHVLSNAIVGHAEFLPPIGKNFFNLAHICTQAHEIKCCAETCLLHQAKWRTAHPFFKAWLHDPDFAHVAGQFATARNVANAGLKNVVNGIHQCRMGMLVLLQSTRPAISHV